MCNIEVNSLLNVNFVTLASNKLLLVVWYTMMAKWCCDVRQLHALLLSHHSTAHVYSVPPHRVHIGLQPLTNILKIMMAHRGLAYKKQG